MLLEIDWFFQHVDWWHVLSIPVFTGVVGWLINWTGLVMLFSPVRFHGVKVPGHAPALAGAAAQDPGGARAPAGRHRLAGDRPGAGRQDGQHRRGQGDRQARHAARSSTSSSSPTRSPSTSCRSSSPTCRHDRRHHAPRAPEPVARPSPPAPGRPSSRGCRPSCRASYAPSPTRSASTSTSCSTRRSW